MNKTALAQQLRLVDNIAKTNSDSAATMLHEVTINYLRAQAELANPWGQMAKMLLKRYDQILDDMSAEG